ncbi:MAG: ABC transporter ATP-binding protein [Burkholderiales bacterium]|nr:ABC transporter ATP-binding protein [Burkholderiales bacterium]
MGVRLHGVRRTFPDGTVALHGLDLAFETGEFIVLLGPSGSGKTTACRLLAGLDMPSAGRIEIDGIDVTAMPPRLRDMGMVFQNYALYAHKTVYENIAYPLRIRKMSAADIQARVHDIARLLQLEPYLGRKPAQLSGGQAQRVAVARALVWSPAICLMDEPLSNLDALLRVRARTELKRLHRDLGTTFVFVTHDQEEAMTLGTRIAVLRDGRLEQFDAPRDVYRRPATRFVAEFVGRPAMNTFDGDVRAGVFASMGLTVPVPGWPDGPVTLGIRPEQIECATRETPGAIAAVVDVSECVEPDTLLFAKCGDATIIVRAAGDDLSMAPGQHVHLRLPPAALHRFHRETGVRLP